MQRKWKRRWQRLTKVILPPVAAGLLFLSAYSPALANPAGAAVVSGSAAISSSGSTTTINQTTNKAIINWQSFSIGKGETVNFVQPGSTSVALNRVIGSDASSIYGSLTANGKVYLINPNGILFAPGSQVNVGGLVASTLNIADSDFLNGKYTCQTDGSAGSVVNQGTITATNEAVLIGSKAANEGIIAAKVTGLAAGNTVSLDFNGDNLLNVTVDTAALNGSATNSGRLTATGGLVVMSAGTKNALLNTVVNNSGIIRAQSVTNAGGIIRLEGNTVVSSGTLDAAGKANGQTGGTVKVLGDTVTLASGSTIDVSGDAGGGTALIGGAYHGGSGEYAATNTTVQRGATIKADAITNGNGGNIVVWANDTTDFAGTITARGGSVSGDGGNVETSGKKTLTLASTARVNTTAVSGTTGTWLLDPSDFTIGTGTTGTNYWNNGELATALESANITVQTDNGSGTDAGDITVSAPVSWNSSNTLTLSAYNNIYLNSSITATHGGLTLAANTSTSGNGTTTGIITPATGSSISVGTFTLQSGTWREISSSLSSFYAKDFRLSGGTFIRTKGGNGTSTTPYQIADVYGLQGIGSTGMLGNHYRLNNNIDASGTQYWNGGAGFVPIGSSTAIYFSGGFDGGGHTITGLTIYRPTTDFVGLFGSSTGTISKAGLLGGSITGKNYVGGLVGASHYGSITNSYSTAAVTGNSSVGGLVGYNDYGSIGNSYSTGSVNGSSVIGGLAGMNNYGSIENSYSTGAVTGNSSVGGLVGYNRGTITSSYWDVNTSGQTTGIGVGTTSGMNADATGLYSATGTSGTAFTELNYSGFDFSPTGAWYMIDGFTRPFLRSEYSTTVTNAHQLQLMALNLTANYTLANDIDMSELTAASGLWRTSATAASNGSYGFVPIGDSTKFTGALDGGGHTISGLYINRSGSDYVGLFGYSSGAISNVGLIGSRITGRYYVGALVGWNYSGTIANCYSTGIVTGLGYAGGLVGLNDYSTINNSYSTSTVTGSYAVGGLAGCNTGTITNSYSIGAVTGTNYVGGLVGYDYGGTIANCYWDIMTSGQTTGIGFGTTTGATGLTTRQWLTNGPVATGTWDTTSTWVAGYPYPVLKTLPYVLVTATGTQVYGSTSPTVSVTAVTDQNGNNAANLVNTSGLSAVASPGSSAGSTFALGGTGATAKPGYQLTYTGTVTVTPAPLTITASDVSKTYGQTAALSAYTVSGLVNGDSVSGVTLTSSGAASSANAGSYSITTANASGSGLGNYTISYQNGTLTVNPATLTITAANVSKTYGQTAALNAYTVSGLLNSDSVSGVTLISSGAASSADAGSYSITAANASGSGLGNYTISYQNGTLTVNPAALTITAANVSKTYGQTAALNAYTVSGLLNSDSVSGVTLTSSGAAASADAGSYSITAANASGSGLGNYTISYVDGTLTVNKAAWQNDGYTGAVIHSNYTGAGLLGPVGRYGQPYGYRGLLSDHLAGAPGYSSTPLTIVPPGVNTSGYTPLTFLSNSGQTDN